jgi:hypothetical protein
MKYIYNTIFILISIIIIFFAGYYYRDRNIEYTNTTIIDTVYVKGEARIDTVWSTSAKTITKHDTIFTGTDSQEEIIITKVDTIYVKEKDIIASIDTIFVSKDSLLKSELEIKYSYNNQEFWIKNVLSYKNDLQKPIINKRSPFEAILYTSGNESSLELGFGASYMITDRMRIMLGYSTSNRIMIGFGVSLP